jgi:outer membrane protein assembly factor BamA
MQEASMAFTRLCAAAFILIFVTPGLSQTGKAAKDLSGYRLIDLQVAGATAFPSEKLMAEFPIRVGEKADWARITKGLDRIKRIFQEAGYLDFKYTPWMDIDKEGKTVSCSFDLQQGPQYAVHRLDLVGRCALSDDAVRVALSKLGLEEGKVFRLSLLDDAIKTLNKLMGVERLTTNCYEYKKLSDIPGMVDVTFRLQPDEN